MNFKNFITFVFLVSLLEFSAQEKEFQKPNYKKIKKTVSKRNSSYYYPKLMKRYLESDDEMTIKEKRFLYYGFAFQKNYKPYAESKYKAVIRKLLNISKPKKTDLDELLRQTNLHLHNHPFDIEILRVKVYAYKRLRSKLDVVKARNQIVIIKDVLISSGNGITKKSAFHIIIIKHEYELLKMLGYKQKGRRKSIEKYEYLKLEQNKSHIQGLYFNLIQGMKAVNE